ncbi:hypothetical protein ACS0TY_029938 [Phlomoides rotata]
MQLGFYALEMAVTHLLHYFMWELLNGMKPSELDMSDVQGRTIEMAGPGCSPPYLKKKKLH